MIYNFFVRFLSFANFLLFLHRLVYPEIYPEENQYNTDQQLYRVRFQNLRL